MVASYAISAGISGIISAGFADKFDRKKFLLFFYVGFIVGTFCCGLADTYAMLLASRIVTGLFGGVIGAASLAIVADLFSISERGRVMGFIQMSFAASQVLGIPAGLFLQHHWGWHYAFFMIVGLGLFIGAAIIFYLKPVNKHLELQTDKSPLLHLWHTFTNKSYQVGYLATAFLAVGGFMLMPFTSAFLVNNIKIAEKNLSLVFLFTGISSIITMPLIGRIADKVDKFKLFAAGSLLAVIMVVIYTNMPPSPLWLVVVVNIILFVGIMSRMIPSSILSTSVPDMRDRGAYMSINSSLQLMAGGIASITAGLIVVRASKTSPLEHFNTLGYIVSAVILCCIFFIYRVSELVKKKMAAKEQLVEKQNEAEVQRVEASESL